MGKTEILAELPKLKPDELAEVQAKLDDLVGNTWLDNDELSDSDKAELDSALADYHKNPDAGCSREQVKARIQAKLSRPVHHGKLTSNLSRVGTNRASRSN